MRRVYLEVWVEQDTCHRPAWVHYRYRREVQQHLKRWRSKGLWLLGEGARAYWWVELEGHLMVEVYHEEQKNRWILTRVSD